MVPVLAVRHGGYGVAALAAPKSNSSRISTRTCVASQRHRIFFLHSDNKRTLFRWWVLPQCMVLFVAWISTFGRTPICGSDWSHRLIAREAIHCFGVSFVLLYGLIHPMQGSWRCPGRCAMLKRTTNALQRRMTQPPASSRLPRDTRRARHTSEASSYVVCSHWERQGRFAMHRRQRLW